jgi:pimeloyl-ACP methyl ester carboxylesterase
VTVLIVGGLAGAPATGGPVGAATPVAAGVARSGETDRLAEAQSHLRRARDYRDASCRMLERGHRHAVDGYFVACQEAWNAMWRCPDTTAIMPEALELYGDAVAGFLEAARQHGRLTPQGIWLGTRTDPILVPLSAQGLPDADRIASVEPRPIERDRRIGHRLTREGIGVPVVIRLGEPVGTPLARFTPPRQSLAATAVLRFDVPHDENFLRTFSGPVSRDHAAAVLDLANPVHIEAVRVAGTNPYLAGDLTAPLLDMLAGRPQQGLEGFLQPFGPTDSEPRLDFLEPHQPGRVPVVFIHGLASDEGTWFDLVNELRAWPVFHARFEPWVFQYPTGAGFMSQSARLRRELRLAVQTLDPDGRDRALRHLVLVGHSMGGLHAKLQVVETGTTLWDAVATQPWEAVRAPAEVRAWLRDNWFFEPQPFVSRVICIGTPHRGSAVASRAVGRLASLMVRPPQQATAAHEALVRLNPGLLRPEFRPRVPTTVDLLEPDSALLRAIEGLRPPCWVSLHSVVGDVRWSVTAGRDDWVVPVSSARTPGAVSEIVVPACHTRLHHHPQTVAEIQRILLQHLDETGLRLTEHPPGPAARGRPAQRPAAAQMTARGRPNDGPRPPE